MSYEADALVQALKIAREYQGLSQRELSERSGVPQAQISKLENGNADVRMSTLVSLSRALGLEVELVPRKHVPAVKAIARQAPNNASVKREGFQENYAVVGLERNLAAIDGHREQLKHLEQSVNPLQEYWEEQKRIERLIDPLKDYREQQERMERLMNPMKEYQELTERILPKRSSSEASEDG